ncbi:MAG: GAF domain-containing protein, partial [Candidatus Acidiferrales bacterium]
MRSAEDRYRTLLDASSTLADQTTVKAVLHSLRDVLFSTSRLHGTELYVLDHDEQSLRVLDFDRDSDAPALKIGTRVSRIGAAARVLEEQKPVFIPDTAQEMLKHPELAPFAAEVVGRSSYLFPVSAAQKRYGFLAATKLQGEEFAPEDVEMLRSLASHVAVALECALARDNAELYQRQVVKERDRLRLLLEINNHIVSKLDINELFR